MPALNTSPLGIYTPDKIISKQQNAVTGINTTPNYSSYITGISNYAAPIYEERRNQYLYDKEMELENRIREEQARESAIATGIQTGGLVASNYKPIYNAGKKLYSTIADIVTPNITVTPAIAAPITTGTGYALSPIVQTATPQLASMASGIADTSTFASIASAPSITSTGMSGSTAVEGLGQFGGAPAVSAPTFMGYASGALGSLAGAEAYGSLADRYNWNSKLSKYTGFGNDTWDFSGRVASGAAIGSMLFPGVGTAAGAAIGGLVGALDFGISKAKKLFKKIFG